MPVLSTAVFDAVGVEVICDALCAFFGAPDTNPIFDKPLHHKGCLVRDTPDAVKHKNKQNVKFLLLGIFLDQLDTVPVFRPDLVTGNAFFL